MRCVHFLFKYLSIGKSGSWFTFQKSLSQTNTVLISFTIRFSFQTPLSLLKLLNIIKAHWEIPHKMEIKLRRLHHTMLVYNELLSFWINVSMKPKFLEISSLKWGSKRIFFMQELSSVSFFLQAGKTGDTLLPLANKLLTMHQRRPTFLGFLA